MTGRQEAIDCTWYLVWLSLLNKHEEARKRAYGFLLWKLFPPIPADDIVYCPLGVNVRSVVFTFGKYGTAFQAKKQFKMTECKWYWILLHYSINPTYINTNRTFWHSANVKLLSTFYPRMQGSSSCQIMFTIVTFCQKAHTLSCKS